MLAIERLIKEVKSCKEITVYSNAKVNQSMYIPTDCGPTQYNAAINESITLSSNITNTTWVKFLASHNLYQKDTTCFFQIKSTSSAHISMRIQHFDLETDYDFLTIGSGDNPSDSKSVLARLTGNPKLRTLTSTHQVWLVFTTDSSGIATGYTIDVYVALPAIARKGQGTHVKL